MVRLLGPGDATLYRAIRLEALETDPDSYGSTAEAEAARPPQAFADRLTSSSVFAAGRGDVLVGMAGLTGEPGAKQAHKAYVWGVFVRPVDRGQGIARALMSAVLALADERFELVTLSVTAGMDPALHLYRTLGFTCFGTLPHSLRTGGRYLDEIMMVRHSPRRRQAGNSGPG